MTTISGAPADTGRPIDVPPAARVPGPRPAEGRLESYRTFAASVLRRCESDPGARSALRSGVRKDLNAVPRMHTVIAHLVPAQASEDSQRAYYAVAAMIAEQARRTDPGGDQAAPAGHDDPDTTTATENGEPRKQTYGVSLGAAFALAVTEGPGRERLMRRSTAESRLNLLCKQSVTGLHRHLPASVRYLRSLDVPVDWGQLLQDLVDWRRYSGRITRRWLQDFYRRCQEMELRNADQADRQDLTAGEEGSPAPAASRAG
ncbi:type I-E CRISPR-associated protein Cse2/CasB [Streptomyces sp. NPDC023998]|uniref:type I-E CRISPR-associated protein Cse2/CasB n=1 Tax=Streptomyces sp. NPDC023998 TaxID=3154597 RepID=UPI0033CCFBBF